jgi:hypothetical protein
VANESARIDVPNDRDVVTLEKILGGFRGAPVRRERRKFADDERFDIGVGGFLVIEIGADIADVRIGEANDLAGIAGIGENFLVAGETGVENNFTAAASASARGAAIK